MAHAKSLYNFEKLLNNNEESIAAVHDLLVFIAIPYTACPQGSNTAMGTEQPYLFCLIGSAWKMGEKVGKE